MKNALIILLSSVLLLGCGQSSSAPVGAEDALFIAHNPLTYTDIPDNDVIRVGEDYYMVSTTMYFCPGAPIMHSKDLVHWRIVSYIYDFLADDDIYNLRDGKNAYGKGQWATSLRYNDGWYYALFVANDQKKSYIYKTRDIVNGPWECFSFDDWFFHDPGLLFDNGRLWVLWGNGELRLTELKPDGSGVIGGDDIVIVAPKKGWGLRAEGTHFYHIGEYYYVIEIDWPLRDIRQVTCWRSKNIEGPYESKLVLRGTLDGRRKDGIAQGPIVDAANGDWYAIQFQDHGAVGRIPTVQRVTWVDGWPIMGNNGKPEQDVAMTIPEDPEGDCVWASDDFDGEKLALVWQWNHKAPDDWKLEDGALVLKAHPAKGIADARGTLTQRTVGPISQSEILLDVSALKEGDEAGLCAFQSQSGRIGVRVKGGERLLTVCNKEKPVLCEPFAADKIYLRIDWDFNKDRARFAWSEDGENWKDSGFTLKMKYTLDYFTGYRSALYCFGGGGGEARFEHYKNTVL